MERRTDASPAPAAALDQGTYEILRSRLASHGEDLRARLAQLNQARQEVFGAIPTLLVGTERISTQNNCIPRDMIPISADRFLFGYNVHIGLRAEVQLADVFSVYQYRDGHFSEMPLDVLLDGQFETDFKNLYRYYKHAVFSKFSLLGPNLFMEFRVGKGPGDIKTFKWLCENESVVYLGNRFDHEYLYPRQHEFAWTRTRRELQRPGLHPHISIDDRVFVECIEGDLTIKVEDNTQTGEGIYAEPVEQVDQTLDDAEIFYATIGNLILLKIRPYQEKVIRYLVFNEKLKQVQRIDAIADSCVLLPDGHGIIFSRGYYLQSGEFKQFESTLTEMAFHKRIPSPNGEDILFTFYSRSTGDYVLLSYNVIARAVSTPILCGGFSIFENGRMAIFRTEEEPQRHHVIQIWQTPFVGASWLPEISPDSFLFKIGNPVLVRGMAECQELLNLIGKDDAYADLYLDLVRRSTDILDSYFWLERSETFALKEPVLAIREAASAALAEFDKVVSLRRTAAHEVTRLTDKVKETLRAIAAEKFDSIEQFVRWLAALRALRGELISLQDLRYADLEALARAGEEVAGTLQNLSQRAVQYLLEPNALEPFRKRVDALAPTVPAMAKVTEAKKLEENIAASAAELDLLIETVTNLKIEDATETTRIVENISSIYAVLNRTRAALKNRIRELRSTEAVAEFASQSRLLDQALSNYLDLCDTPDKCDTYYNRLLVQVEELEARFADFPEFVIQLSEKRTTVCSAFESRKLELVETRNRKASALLTAAERILKSIRHRVLSLQSLDEIHGYFAGDAMVDKVRQQVAQFVELGDSVKADDVQSRLKTVHEEAVRQLKDRQDLSAHGHDILQFGRHQFRINTQELDLTVVPRGEEMCVHVTGTNFFEPINDPAFLATRSVWPLEIVAETPQIYRAEFLAYNFLSALTSDGRIATAAQWNASERLAQVQSFMTPRYREGYVRGVHDNDAAQILGALVEMQSTIGLLRYPSKARACAMVFWQLLPQGEDKNLLAAKLRGYGTMKQLFPSHLTQEAYVRQLHGLIYEWVKRTGLFEEGLVPDAAEYLYFQLKQDGEFVVSSEAADLCAGFRRHLVAHHFEDAFEAARVAVQGNAVTSFELLLEWVRSYARSVAGPTRLDYIDEATALVWRGTESSPSAPQASLSRTLDQLAGSHPRIAAGTLPLHYIDFMHRLRAHQTQVVPIFDRCQTMKKDVLEQARRRLRLDEFRPRVLTSFVRNQLIDSVYLPLVGDNLAKQMGTAGEDKRTDRMGLLLLVSPPGYGKTTLMEYVASRLGVVFVKISGPALSSRVTSLDPAEAPNAAAREELNKLNLAFELGDNVMVCLDDIQHLHSEFLQKFISLCDAQRRIEGVYHGHPRTYDLRGKKIAVVMAGNPYTESGDKFQVPDMLANRADTYNLGDVLGGHAPAFALSYLENAAGSNPVLARVAHRSQRDLQALVRLATQDSAEGIDFEGTYSPQELAEFTSVMKKLLRVRDVVLRVNEEYIKSAAQADAYRTEPPFKLQGSYRNMNRLAEKVSAVMNDQELETLLHDHYRNEAQILTQGAEANLLKFKSLTNALTAPESARWEEIRKTFRKTLLFRNGDGRDPVAQVVQQLSAFGDGLDAIKEVLATAMKDRNASGNGTAPLVLMVAPAQLGTASETAPPAGDASVSPRPALNVEGLSELRITPETLQKIWQIIEQDRNGKKEG